MPTFDGPAGALAYDFDRGARFPERGFVFCHGFASVRSGEKATLLRARAAELGWSYFAFDARAHGESAGSMRDFTFSGYLDDLAAFLEGPAASLRRIALIGSSLGGTAALFHAARRPKRIEACVAVAPALANGALFTPSSRAEADAWARSGVRRVRNGWIDVELGYGFVQDVARHDFASLKTGLRTPTLIVQGRDDDVCPAETTVRFWLDFPGKNLDLLLVGGGDHRLSAAKEKVQAALEDFVFRAFAEGERDG
ncbi:MAG TPA: alpha/beta fold hydrolase [Planctomycetota bacterium]|nr:alpha/beta fold hydrolase [Planctomycetota bacterium]